MNRGLQVFLQVLVWVYRILSVVTVIGTFLVVLLGARIAAIVAEVRGTSVARYDVLPVFAGGLLMALAFFTVGEVLAALGRIDAAQQETADTLARMRRRER